MDGYRHGLTDPQWKILKPLMEQVGGTNGRKPVDNRRWIDALFWMSKAGLPWRDLPPAFGKWRSVHDRFADWAKSATLGASFRVARRLCRHAGGLR